SILFFSASVQADYTFGETIADLAAPIAILEKLVEEFGKAENWQALPPSTGQLFVTLRPLGAPDALVLHPVGTLRISQRFAPLNLPLDKVGNQPSGDIRRASVSVAAGTLSTRGATREKFAVAQYRTMDDAAKLSAPAYQPFDSGVELGPA